MASINDTRDYTALKELNSILAKMDIPNNKKVVCKAGSNLAWLKKHLHVRNEVGPRCVELLNMSMGELCK